MIKVRLLKDWECYKKNSVLGLIDSDAKRLIQEGIAEEVGDEIRMRVYESAEEAEEKPECVSEPSKKNK